MERADLRTDDIDVLPHMRGQCELDVGPVLVELLNVLLHDSVPLHGE